VRRSDPVTRAVVSFVLLGLVALTLVAITALGCAAVFGNWLRAGAPDSQYAREIVVRVSTYGGTYFDNAVLNRGPLEQWAHSLASHITQRIAGSMARELKQQPEKAEQEQLTEAVQKLFHLPAKGRTPTAQSH
jgi:hypothetical protein